MCQRNYDLYAEFKFELSVYYFFIPQRNYFENDTPHKQ